MKTTRSSYPKRLLSNVCINFKLSLFISSFSEELWIRCFKVPCIGRNGSDWAALPIVSHLERRWGIIWGRWLSFEFIRWTCLPFGMRLKCVMDTFIISVCAIWSEWWVFLVHVWWGRWLLLLRKLFSANWTNDLHGVVKCTVIESLSFLRLTRKWIERRFLQL